LEWYHIRILSTTRARRMDELARPAHTPTEYRRLIEAEVEDKVFKGTVAAVALVGAFHGFVLGPIVGALWQPSIE
jgi:hypothetical protein